MQNTKASKKQGQCKCQPLCVIKQNEENERSPVLWLVTLLGNTAVLYLSRPCTQSSLKEAFQKYQNEVGENVY